MSTFLGSVPHIAFGRLTTLSFLLLAQKKGAKKKAADFDAEAVFRWTFLLPKSAQEMNSLEHIASNTKQDGMICLCCTTDAERVIKIIMRDVCVEVSTKLIDRLKSPSKQQG
jgi:hypothetical protein